VGGLPHPCGGFLPVESSPASPAETPRRWALFRSDLRSTKRGSSAVFAPEQFCPSPLRLAVPTPHKVEILLSQGAGRCGREGMAFAHIYAQSKRVVTSNAAPFTRIQMGACSSFPVVDWASETCAPVDRGLSVSQSMRHPLEILRSPTSARPFELVRDEYSGRVPPPLRPDGRLQRVSQRPSTALQCKSLPEATGRRMRWRK